MTMKQLENMYSVEDVGAVWKMMCMGWDSSDDPEEIARYHEISLEDAKSIHEIMKAIEETVEYQEYYEEVM